MIHSRFRASHLVILFAWLGLTGCAGLTGGELTGSNGGRAADIASEPTLSVVTTRKAVNGARAEPWFGSERASQMSIARVRLSSPSQAGRFSMAAAGLADWRIEQVERAATLLDSNAAAASGPRDVLLYVHGYNQTFATAVLDAARLADGLNFHGNTVLFSWPSRNKLLDYISDRESAMWSRDALETTLDGLMTNPNVGRIHIVAHSMGSMLTIEGLRQVYARHGDAAADKIGAIVFASPDLDVDSFASSVRRMARLAPNMTVVIAGDDRALAIASRVAGGARVGAAEKAKLDALGLKVIDASGMGWGILNHDLFLRNGEVQKVIARAIADADGRSGFFARTATPPPPAQ